MNLTEEESVRGFPVNSGFGEWDEGVERVGSGLLRGIRDLMGRPEQEY